MQNKVALAQSKAGRRFMGFMRVLNTGDMDAICDFVASYTTEEALAQNPLGQWQENLENIYKATGGLRVFQVVGTDEYQVAVLMQAHNTGALLVATLAVSEDYPHKMAEFVLRPA